MIISTCRAQIPCHNFQHLLLHPSMDLQLRSTHLHPTFCWSHHPSGASSFLLLQCSWSRCSPAKSRSCNRWTAWLETDALLIRHPPLCPYAPAWGDICALLAAQRLEPWGGGQWTSEQGKGSAVTWGAGWKRPCADWYLNYPQSSGLGNIL